jgi:acid stress chaperone HdeB
MVVSANDGNPWYTTDGGAIWHGSSLSNPFIPRSQGAQTNASTASGSNVVLRFSGTGNGSLADLQAGLAAGYAYTATDMNNQGIMGGANVVGATSNSVTVSFVNAGGRCGGVCAGDSIIFQFAGSNAHANGWIFANYLKSQPLCADRVNANTFYIYNSGTTVAPGAGIWKSTDSGATFKQRRAGHFQNDGSNQRLLCVSGSAGNLYFSSGTQNAPPTGQTFYGQGGGSVTCTGIVRGSTSPNDGTVNVRGQFDPTQIPPDFHWYCCKALRYLLRSVQLTFGDGDGQDRLCLGNRNINPPRHCSCSRERRYNATDLHQLFDDVARSGPYLLRLDERLARSEMVGVDDFARNVADVRQWCTDNAQATIMAALDHSVPQPGPLTGQQIDMSQVTCKQYLSSDADRQDMIGYWMSGYFRASRNQPIFDFRAFADNNRALTNYCKKHGSETVMSAIQNGVR